MGSRIVQLKLQMPTLETHVLVLQKISTLDTLAHAQERESRTTWKTIHLYPTRTTRITQTTQTGIRTMSFRTGLEETSFFQSTSRLEEWFMPDYSHYPDIYNTPRKPYSWLQ